MTCAAELLGDDTGLRVGEISLPDHFRADPAEQKAISRLVNSRFPFEVELKWELTRAPFQAVIYKVQQCPYEVLFADWVHVMDGLNPGEVFIGLDRHHEPFIGSFRGADPHWVFEVQSRRGKSTMLSVSIAQILHQDPAALAMGVDPKMESFKALAGVPEHRFQLADDPDDVQEMWDCIKSFRDLMYERRADRAKDKSLEFPYAILAVDEANSFSILSKIRWRNIKGPGDPPYPPVWEDLAMILAQGGAYHCHVIMTGQRLDETIFGGLRLISMMGFRGLGGFRKANYVRLLGGGPVPIPSTRRGRWLYGDGESETWVQNVLGTDDEINDYARTLVNGSDPVVPLIRPQKAEQPAPAAQAPIVGLDAAAEHLGLTKAAFVRRRQKRPVPGETRHGNQPAFLPADLQAWASGELTATQTGEQ